MISSMKSKCSILKTVIAPLFTQSSAGLKHFQPPANYDHVEFTDRAKLKIIERVPQYSASLRPPKMTKRLILMRGPELVHNELLHKQYGIVALGGGRLRYGHYEMLRLGIGRKLDVTRMFAVWRIPPPWQPVTKKGQGQRMGGGKGAIDHYVTPIRAGRVIVEIGGKCEFDEVKGILGMVCHNLPFKAIVVSQEILDQRAREEKYIAENNTNPFTMKYVIQNNLSGCHNWLGKFDHKWFGKYL